MKADIIFIATGATSDHVILLVKQRKNYEQSLHKITHFAKFLRKMFNKNVKFTHIALSLCILEHLRYFVANLVLSQFTLFLRSLLGPKIVVP